MGGNFLETCDARSQVLPGLTPGACIPSARRHQKAGEGLECGGMNFSSEMPKEEQESILDLPVILRLVDPSDFSGNNIMALANRQVRHQRWSEQTSVPSSVVGNLRRGRRSGQCLFSGEVKVGAATPALGQARA